MTLSGMRAPNKQKFWPARNWTATDGTVGRPSGWTGVSVSNRMRVVSRHLSSHSTQLRSWGHETLWSWPRARFAKRENRSKITSCRSKAYWTAQLGRWTVRPPPQQQAFGTAPREGTYGISLGRLRRGEIRTTARDITRFRLPECRVMGKSIWPTKIQDIFEIAASRAAVRCPREGLDRWLEWPVALGLSQLSRR